MSHVDYRYSKEPATLVFGGDTFSYIFIKMLNLKKNESPFYVNGIGMDGMRCMCELTTVGRGDTRPQRDTICTELFRKEYRYR